MAVPNGPLHEMTLTTPTRYWTDSCSVEELNYSIPRGANGATSNPVIVLNVLKKEMPLWRERILQIIAENDTWSETQVSWQVYKEVAVRGSELLLPVFEREEKRGGRMSIQTDPALYRNSEALLEQTAYFSTLAPNMQVKMPATRAGIGMVEEATYQGINLNVTVSYTVPQVIAAAEAIERGLRRREAEGKDISSMTPVVTLMMGRNDDWMKAVAAREKVAIDPAYLDWAGLACFKKAYAVYTERGYRPKLLGAAVRNFKHWTEIVGGDVILTIPYDWQVKINESGLKPEPRMQVPVDEEIIKTLRAKLPDFRQAYDEDGLTVPGFDTYGLTINMLRIFIEGWHNFVAVIRDLMLPDPNL